MRQPDARGHRLGPENGDAEQPPIPKFGYIAKRRHCERSEAIQRSSVHLAVCVDCVAAESRGVRAPVAPDLVPARAEMGAVQAPATQARLLEFTEIINRILPWCGSVPQAFAWYRSEPIPAFGDQTAEELVRGGRSEHVKNYLAAIAIGGYA